MLQGIIFDLDETLVDSTSLKKFRKTRDWKSCYKNLKDTSLYDGALSVLKYCKDNNLKIGIVTMSPRPYAEKILKYHNIKIDSLIAYHDVNKRKPDSEPMKRSISTLGLKSYNVISIGDDIKDIQSSINTGIEAYGVDWGVHSSEDLYEAGAKEVFNDFGQLMNLLNNKLKVNL